MSPEGTWPLERNLGITLPPQPVVIAVIPFLIPHLSAEVAAHGPSTPETLVRPKTL